MDNILQTALAEAVNALASFFGTTTEAIMAHAPEFLAKYGWYATLHGLPITAFLCILSAGLIYLIIALVTMFEIDHPFLVFFTILIICLIIGIGSSILTCVAAPEIVGIHAILDLLNNTSG